MNLEEKKQMQNYQLTKEFGITLVSLIITIIVLIILAAISINAVFKSQFIDLALQSTLNYAEAQTDEQKKMEALDTYMQSAIKDIDAKNLTPSVIDKITDIGKYIDYIPTFGAYTTKSQYTGSADINPLHVDYSIFYNIVQNFSTDTNLKWRIFKIDSKNLYLISDRPPIESEYNNGSLYLHGPNGYNNGVKLLNDISKACYSNNSLGAEARNLRIEDIEDVTKFDYKNFLAEDNSTGFCQKYNGTKTYKSENSNYPMIWKELENGSSAINNRSVQENFINGAKQGEADTTFVGNHWHYKYSPENAVSEWLDSKYYELLISPTNDTNYYSYYYLSSRYIAFYQNHCSFGLQFIGHQSFNIWSTDVYDSKGNNIRSFSRNTPNSLYTINFM